jgi:Fe2+ or Zn2+ uptake regulation protein
MAEKGNTAYASLLRERGLKATPQRLQLLALLSRAKRPVSIPELQAGAEGGGMDTATFYRGLETLTAATLVRKVDLRHGHTDYELMENGKHHHHLVCTICGHIEKFTWCPDNKLRKQILKQTKGFTGLDDHSLEFFGVCKKCA